MMIEIYYIITNSILTILPGELLEIVNGNVANLRPLSNSFNGKFRICIQYTCTCLRDKVLDLSV